MTRRLKFLELPLRARGSLSNRLEKLVGAHMRRAGTGHQCPPGGEPPQPQIRQAVIGADGALPLGLAFRQRGWVEDDQVENRRDSASHAKASAWTASRWQAITAGFSRFRAKLRAALSKACALMSRSVTERAPPLAA